MKSKRFHLSSIMIVIGALLFILVGIIAAWGDIKSISFDNQTLASAPLKTLRCPALLTSGEADTISALIVNETKKDVSIPVRAVITNGVSGEPQTLESDVLLGSYESQELTWTINAQNAGGDYFILARVHKMVYSSNPYLNASCGILAINIPFMTGSQLILTVMGLAALLAATGLLIWGIKCTPKDWRTAGFKRWLFLTGVALLLAVFGLSSYWGAALFLVFVWVLQLIELIIYFNSQKRGLTTS